MIKLESRAEQLAAELVRRLKASNPQMLDGAKAIALDLMCEEFPDARAGDLRERIARGVSSTFDGTFVFDFDRLLADLTPGPEGCPNCGHRHPGGVCYDA